MRAHAHAHTHTQITNYQDGNILWQSIFKKQRQIKYNMTYRPFICVQYQLHLGMRFNHKNRNTH